MEFYDTRTRSRRAFAPITPGHVRMYSCGPTVYGPPHIGNLRSRLFSDLLKRFLLSEGFRVTHVINITDVGHLVSDADEGEDKIEAAARRTGKSAEEIAAHYTQVWRDDGAAVNCLPPEHNPKATEHIPEQIDLAKRLEAGGYLYRIEDGLYFDTSRFPRYAELAHLDLAGQAEGARIGVTAGKRNPADFAVWKFAEAGVQRQQEWDSPWGRGFPGWHLECSAMADRYLGHHFDIHTGGIDLASVHHTNEVAQSECGYGVHPWVEFWMHNEFLDMGSEKMSKSKGNVRTLSDLVEKGVDPLAFRYFFLQAHYRQQQSFSDEAIQSAATGYRRLQAVARELGVADAAAGEPTWGAEEAAAVAELRARFRAALADDLNAPKAMAVVWEVARHDRLSPAARRDLLRGFDAVLGLRLGEARLAVADESGQDPRIDGLLAERQAAKKARNFAEADRIRDALKAEGIEIVDTPAGPEWRRGKPA
ncbi:MAG: cysteine--tRNA ligase [Deltaproteobacteria bacterium]|nr:cysteine--tRNA ligase [Deltaproteobacteria bacterium]